MATRELKVNIVGDSKDLERALGRSAKASGGLGRAFAGLAKTGVLVGAALGAAAAVGIKKSIDAASNLTEQVNKANVVFRGSEKQVLDWSKGLESSFGLSQRAALEAAGTFGNMLVPMGYARKEAAGMSEQMVELAGDMASFNNASPEDTLLAIRSGLAGEAEPLRKYGVFLSEARVQQEALAETGKKNVKELTNQEKATARYNLILKDTKDTQGDFARSAGTSMANQMRILRASLEDVAAGLGQIFLPLVIKAFGFINDNVIPIIQDAVEWMDKFFGRFDKAKTIKGKMSVVGDAFKDLGRDVATAVSRALLGWDKIIKGPPQAREAPTIVHVEGVAEKLAAAFAALNWDKVGAAILDGIANSLKGAAQLVKQLGDTITAAMREVNWEKVGQAMGPGLLTAVMAAFVALLDPAFWVRNWELALAVAINAAALLFPELFATKLIAPLSKVGSDLVWAIARPVERFFGPRVAEVLVTLMMKIPGLLAAPFRLIESGVRSFFGRLGGLAVFTVRVLGVAAVITAITRLVSDALDALGRFIRGAGEIGRGVSRAIRDGIAAGWHWIVEQLGKLSSALSSAAITAAAWAGSIGVAIVEGILDGIGNLGQRLLDKVKGAISWALSKIPGQPFGSDLAGYSAEQIGHPITAGAVEGVSTVGAEIAKKLHEQISKALQGVQDARGAFASAFSSLADAALSGFDAAVSAWKPKSQIKLDKMQLADQIRGEKEAIVSAQKELNAARATAAQEGTAENIQRVKDAEAALAAARRSQQEGELARDAVKEQAAHDVKMARRRIQFKNELDALQEHLAKLADQEAKAREAGDPKKAAALHAQQLKLIKQFREDYRKELVGVSGDSKFWGTAAGISLADGLSQAMGPVLAAVRRLARVLERYLKLKQKASWDTEEGPMSDFGHWWDNLADGLIDGIDYSAITKAGTFVARSFGVAVKDGMAANTTDLNALFGFGKFTVGAVPDTTPFTENVSETFGDMADNVTGSFDDVSKSKDALGDNIKDFTTKATDVTKKWANDTVVSLGRAKAAFVDLSTFTGGGTQRFVFAGAPAMTQAQSTSALSAVGGTAEIHTAIHIDSTQVAEVVRREYLRFEKRNGRSAV